MIVEKMNYKESMFKELQKSLQIPSVKGIETSEFPFGKEIDLALRHVLDVADKLGFKTKYGNGYYGFVEFGEGNELIGILGHVDVVPVGEVSQWMHHPFDGKIVDDILWGRGTLDDKGAVFAVLYAMKRLMDESPNLDKRIRLIIGTDEESGWACIDKYLEREEIPDYGFSPDAEFPVVQGEKGIIQFEISSAYDRLPFELMGGTAGNVVPDRCLIKSDRLYKNFDLLKLNNLTYSVVEDTIIVNGKAAHASVNWEGENAITKLLSALQDETDNQMIKFINDKIGMSYYGEKIFNSINEDISGQITLLLGVLEMKDDSCKGIVDVRVPVTQSVESAIDEFKLAASKYDIKADVLVVQKPLYVEKKHRVVKCLMEAYNHEMSSNENSITMGGGTYAKAFKDFVAFGPLFPGEEDTAHCVNERISISSLYKAMDIYYEAIKRLSK